MPFVRLTVAHARPERREEVKKHYRELVDYVRKLPGCVGAYVLTAEDGTGDVGRMTLWENEAAANHAANDPHAMSLHAELMFDVSGEMWDRTFDANE